MWKRTSGSACRWGRLVDVRCSPGLDAVSQVCPQASLRSVCCSGLAVWTSAPDPPTTKCEKSRVLWHTPPDDPGRMRVHKFLVQRRVVDGSYRGPWDLVYDGIDLEFMESVQQPVTFEYRVQVIAKMAGGAVAAAVAVMGAWHPAL